MKRQALFLSALLAAAGACAVEAFAQGDGKAREYAYGMQLDVAEVVAIEEAPHGRCEPVDSKMTYRDSRGQLHTVSYVKQDGNCF
jgi:uncharacterized protein YggE